MGGNEKKPLTKTELLQALADASDLNKNEVTRVIDALGNLITEGLSERGPGVVNIPGLMKIKVVRKPATPERKGINPFTKQETVIKAKPARNAVKIIPLKGLKDRV